MNWNKICRFCGNRFVAKKTTTKCCSDDCAKKFYKKRKRDEKIQASDKDLEVQFKGYDIEEIQKKDYLSIKEVMLLLNVSRTLSKLESFKSVRIRKVDLGTLYVKSRK